MKKIIIEIDDKQYKDAINDTEWNTLSLGIYLKEQVKKGKPLQTELEDIKVEIDTMLKSDEIKNDKWANVIINKSYLFKRIINKHIAELEGEMYRSEMTEYPFSRTDCLSYEEAFCEARDCGECACRE